MRQERIRLVEHKGKQVLVVDLAGLVNHEVLPVIIDASKKIRSHPPGSLLALTDATTVEFSFRNETGDYDRVAAESIRSCIAGNRPHVKASAVAVGNAEGKRVIVEFFNRVSDRQFEVFSSADEALDWLVEQ